MATGVTPAAAAAITGAEGVAGLYWWRAVSESLVRAGKMPRARLLEILRDGEARARGLAIPYVKGDFQAFGKPYATLTAEEQKAASMIAEARVRAFRWMLDDDVPWDDVGMDSGDQVRISSGRRCSRGSGSRLVPGRSWRSRRADMTSAPRSVRLP